MNPQTMLPLGEKKALIAARQDSLGYKCCEDYDSFIEGFSDYIEAFAKSQELLF